jgi:hypothetical protein
LIGNGLEHFLSENTPLWYWYAAVDGFSRSLLPLYSVIGAPAERRTGVLCAMRLISEPLLSGLRFSREDYITSWLSKDAPNALKVAALGYLGDCGIVADLPAVKQELSSGNYQTRSASIDAIIRINLRDSREKAISALYELQPETINRTLLAALFENGASISTDIISQGVEHRSSEVRRITVKLLRDRRALEVEAAQRLTADSDAMVRFEAVQSLVSWGKSFSDDEAKMVLVKPAAPRNYGLGGAFGGADSAGEACWNRFREQRMFAMPERELEGQVAGETSIFERTARFVLDDRHFSTRGDTLRRSVDDHFKAEFNEALEKLARDFGNTTDLLDKTRSLEEYVRKNLTRKGLDVICRKSRPQDLGRVRMILKSGFVDYSEADVEYLRKFGEWEDIRLIVASVDRPDSGLNTLLSSFADSAKYRIAARAIYSLGRTRLAELLTMAMPSRLLSHLIVESSDKVFRVLSDTSLSPLLFSEDDGVRKAAALKCVRSLPKTRLKAILEDYVSGERQIYYNVVHWLDLGVSAPRHRAVLAAEKVIAKVWRE